MSAGPLFASGRLHVRVELHGPQVDVLVQLEAQAQEDALLEDARLHVGMSDGAEVDRVEPAERVHRVVGERLAGLQVLFAAPVEVGEGEGKENLPAAAVRTLMPSRTTSGPVPSPGMTAILLMCGR